MIAPLIIVPALALALAGWVLLVRKVVVPAVDAEVVCSPASIAYGAEAEVAVSIRNASRFPCPFVVCELGFPAGLARCGPASNSTQYTVRLGARETVKMRIRVTGVKRGRQHISQLTLYVSDGFTMHRYAKEVPLFLTVTVHPRRVPAIPALSRTNRLGMLASERRLAPTSVDWVDMREYRPGDPVRDIAWTASARQGRLVVLERALAISREIVVVASVRVAGELWQTSAAHADRVYEVSYGMMEALTRQGLQFLYFSDAVWSDTRRRTQSGSILRGHGVWSKHVQKQMGHLLGTLSAFCATTLDEVLERVEHEVPAPAHIVVLTGYLDAAGRRRMEAMERRGYAVDTIWLVPKLTQNTSAVGVSAP